MCRVIFAGTRRLDLVPAAYSQLIVEAAEHVASTEGTLQSTAAPGVEQRIVESVLKSGGRVELLLPWPAFEQRWVDEQQRKFSGSLDVTVFDPVQHAPWLKEVERRLPRVQNVAAGIRKHYACYYGLLTGAQRLVVLPYPRTLPSRPPDKRAGDSNRHRGGVLVPEAPSMLHRGSAEVVIELAECLEVPYVDLSDGISREALYAWLADPQAVS